MSPISQRKGWWITLACALTLAVGMGIAVSHETVVGQKGTAARVESSAGGTPHSGDAAVAHAKALSQAFRKAAERATPSVVKIQSHVDARPVRASPARRGNPLQGTPFEDLFREYGDMQGMVPQRDGVGSGVIIDAEGIVLTNNHVVEGADSVTVRLADGREFKATDIKTDPETDLAVLRINDAKDLPAATLGDSDQLEIGDWVIAIGNPFALESTVSAGIISAKGRELGAARRAKFLQTDAAINPGNSGGPLVNLEGEVIGINTAIASSNGGYQGIGFAVPSTLAKWVVGQLIEKGSVQRGYLGVAIAPITPDLATQFGVQPGGGVLVMDVTADSPAAAAGLREGDVIKSFGGKAVSGPRELQEVVERTGLDSRHDVVIVREGKQQTLQVDVKQLPDDIAQLRSSPQRLPEEGDTNSYFAKELGLEVTELGGEFAQRFAGYEGVVISKIEPDSVAARAGLQPGMLIRKVGKIAVGDMQQFAKALESQSLESGIMLQIRTAVGNRFVVLKAT